MNKDLPPPINLGVAQLVEFSVRSGDVAGSSPAAQTNHYTRNKAIYKLRSAVAKQKVRSFISRVKRRSHCLDCGNNNPIVLEFDHLSNKEADIATASTRGWSIERVKLEIRKCDIVCGNCHKIRTHTRRLAV